ncbi:hypothetical protein [Pararhodobacter oceanensis]|uniref:Uncharacterized protein n=1 Tax=Pararhodobacter oceanensis TaxID=2172121 RepID=A0A2T8HQM1_9RHOB|nr:hypothetical protein [Pararhodobacter oceanensis]PVH27726.1 hypothetical protein DDE20_15560 [Pararhodobacter oceanensis]
MPENKTLSRIAYVGPVLVRLGGKLFLPPDADEILPLGEDYNRTMTRILAKRNDFLAEITKRLAAMSDEELAQSYDREGKPQTEAEKSWFDITKRRILDAFSGLSTWYLAPLFRTSDLANFEHWGRSSFWSLDEVVWLSVGLEPSASLSAAASPYDQFGRPRTLKTVALYMSRHTELLRREFQLFAQSEEIKANALLRWIERVNFPVHPEFLAMLQQAVGDPGSNSSVPTVERDDNGAGYPDAREKVSLAKLLTAIATDAYGYDPSQPRSPIPGEIASIADKLGLSVSKDTIRKYLQLGAQHLPPDWNAE